MFSPVSVCLSVCLSATLLKKLSARLFLKGWGVAQDGDPHHGLDPAGFLDRWIQEFFKEFPINQSINQFISRKGTEFLMRYNVVLIMSK